MGLYDERLNEASRRSRRVADRRGRIEGLRSRPFAEVAARRSPFSRVRRAFTEIPSATEASRSSAATNRPSMDIQSLLFGRNEWTEGKAKDWAKSHGYKYGKTDITDQYIRIRQFDPKGLKVKRTITLGRGIRAVVAREEDTAMKRRRTTKKASSRRTAKRSGASSAAKPAFGSPAWRAMYPRKSKGKRKARRTREAPVVAETKRPRRRAKRARESVVAAPRRRKARRARESVVATPKRRKARRARESVVATPRRRRRARRSGHVMAKTTTVRAWRGNSAGHSKAAKKGHKRRKAKRRTTRESVVAAPRRRRNRKAARRTREFTYESSRVASPRRRKARRARESVVTSSRRRPKRYRAHAASSKLSTMGKRLGKLALFTASAAVSFQLVDWADRYLATYNPAGPADKLPKDKFTSDGAGTLANALNVASAPHVLRIVNAVASTLIPAVASAYVNNSYLRGSLEGAAVGAGVKAFSLFFSNVLMPMLAPKGDDVQALQKSHIARLYPAEVAAHINLKEKLDKNVSTTPGALSGSSPDVGPFAVGGPSPYPTAAESLRAEARAQAGMSGPSPYPNATEALQAGVDGPYGYRPAPPIGRPSHPVAAQWHGAHPMYRPGGYAHSAAWSQRWGNRYQPSFHVPAGTHHHHHCMLRAKAMYPSYTDAQLHQWCAAHPYNTHPYLYAAPAPPTGVGEDLTNTGLSPQEVANALPVANPPPGSAPQGPAPQMPASPVPTPDPVGPPTYHVGPGTGPGPGPVPINQECGCVGESNNYLGFIGDAEEKELLFSNVGIK
jgi:hypothetical protein